VFGLDWLGLFFCSNAFCEKLRALGVPAKSVEILSDHWNVLNSGALSDALRSELEWVHEQHPSKSGAEKRTSSPRSVVTSAFGSDRPPNILTRRCLKHSNTPDLQLTSPNSSFDE